jgi:hypothetical protein
MADTAEAFPNMESENGLRRFLILQAFDYCPWNTRSYKTAPTVEDRVEALLQN